MRWEGSQRVSKASIQAKASGIHHHRVILTTIRSSFSKDDTYTSSSSSCHSLATLTHRAFVCSIQLIYYRFCESVSWLASLSALYVFCFGQDAALHFDIDPSSLFMYFCLVELENFQPNPAVKTWGIWQRLKASCHHTELQMHWPGQTLKYQSKETKHFLMWSVRQTATSMHTQSLLTWIEVNNLPVLANKPGKINWFGELALLLQQVRNYDKK